MNVKNALLSHTLELKAAGTGQKIRRKEQAVWKFRSPESGIPAGPLANENRPGSAEPLHVASGTSRRSLPTSAFRLFGF